MDLSKELGRHRMGLALVVYLFAARLAGVEPALFGDFLRTLVAN